MSIPALGLLFEGAAGGSLFGSILSGAASAWSKAAERKEEEKAQIREEQRAEARYADTGEAMKFWDQPMAETSVEDNSEASEISSVDATLQKAGVKLDAPGKQRSQRRRYDPQKMQIVDA